MTERIPEIRDSRSEVRTQRGLREAHAHIAAHGRAMTMTRFESCRSAGEFLDRLASAAAKSGSDPPSWALGGGVRVQAWDEPRLPGLREIDRVTGARPVCVWSFDYHAVIANSAALAAAGFEAGMADPEHGRIERDAGGNPTGLLLEAAAKWMWSRVPEPGPSERRGHLEAALAELAGHGFVEVHDLLSPPWLGAELGALERAGRLPVSVRLYPALADLDATLGSLERERWGSERVSLAGAKVFADGTLNSRTAWMLEPIVDPMPGLPCGEAMMTRESLGAAMTRAWSLGLGLAVHAIGDGAVRAVLDAFERTGGESQRPVVPDDGGHPFAMAPRERRVPGARRSSEDRIPALRVEHAEIIDGADVPRFPRLGVVVSVQPCHLLADVEALRRHLPHRMDRVLPLRELIDSGCRPGELLWFGSDVPIVRPHPADSIRAAVRRSREGGEPIAPEQAITEAEAWAAFQSPL